MLGGWRKDVPTVAKLEAMKARLWRADLHLWMWKWQTLTGAQRGWMFYWDQNFPKPPRPKFIKSGDVFNRHRIFSVLYPVQVQKDIVVRIPSGFMHCERCKIMGSIETFERYHCS